jgi:hypothetical protein
MTKKKDPGELKRKPKGSVVPVPKKETSASKTKKVSVSAPNPDGILTPKNKAHVHTLSE